MNDKVFEIRYNFDDTEIWFRQEVDDEGRLISQEQTVSRWNGEYRIPYSLKRPQKTHIGEVLYHVTRKENVPYIREHGLEPRVGACYANHWIWSHENESLIDKLYPGVFLLSGKRICKRDTPGYKTVKVKVDDLDSDFLFVDSAWKDEKSLFYTKVIPPEKLIITR
jgi:hypothetical protein